MIRISNLSMRFGGVSALDSVDATLKAPITGLIGPNGAGKTTLLNVITGFLTPTSGSVFLGDQNINGFSPQRRAQLGLRRTFQHELTVPGLTVYDNIQAASEHVSDGLHTVQDIATFITMETRLATPGAELNMFERRLTETGKALVGHPRVILMDEPAAGLDENESKILRDIIRRIPETFDARVVLIDHDAALIADLCQEILVLDFGKKLIEGPTQVVLNDAQVRRAYLGEDISDNA